MRLALCDRASMVSRRCWSALLIGLALLPHGLAAEELRLRIAWGGGTERTHRVGLSVRAVDVKDGRIIYAELGQGVDKKGYSQAAKLNRILAGYAQNLSDNERDLLIRLSIFPRGVSVEILGYLIAAGGEIAGALVGFGQSRLMRLAKRLCTLGLVYTYNLRNTITYTAHPFLREYFRELLGVPPEKIHESVRGKLAVGLETKPDNKPRDRETLDRYEALYNRLNVTVFNEDNEPVDAVTYIQSGQPEESKPSPEYISVIQQGYKDWRIV